MNKTLQILLTLLLTFCVPMLTSWLLDLSWISGSWPRYSLVLLLMLFEVVLGIFLLKLLLQRKS